MVLTRPSGGLPLGRVCYKGGYLSCFECDEDTFAGTSIGCKVDIKLFFFLHNATEHWFEHSQCMYLLLITFTTPLPKVLLKNRFVCLFS